MPLGKSANYFPYFGRIKPKKGLLQVSSSPGMVMIEWIRA